VKIVVLSNAHHLAHVSRPLEVAKVLRERGHEVVFAGHGKFLEVATWERFPVRNLPYVPAERAAQIGRSAPIWKWFRDVDLEGFVAAELALYRELRPDLVLIDNRVTARASADKAGLCSAAILNVHMSNYRRIPYFSMTDLGVGSEVPGMALLDKVENAIELRYWDQLVMSPVNRLRRRLGLRRLYAHEHEEGELALFPDVPEFNPVRKLPQHARYVGPLTWHNGLPAPRCLRKLAPNRPTVYLSLGSVGLGQHLIERLAALIPDIQIVSATGGRPIPAQMRSANVFLEPYVNTDLLLPHCDLVCCHGGNGTLYQALAFGLPLVVVATHNEQLYGGKRIEHLALGRTLKQRSVERHGPGLVAGAVSQVLADPSFRTRAESMAKILGGWGAAHLAAAEVERYAGAL